MRRATTLSGRAGALALGLAALVLAAADGPAAKAPKASPKPPAATSKLSPKAAALLPELNRKVLEFCRDRVGQQVGNGECTMLAYEALKAAGARRFGWASSGDYVWGRPVAGFGEALPGDVVQFRDAVFDGKRTLPRRRWMTWHHEYPHHTAVVAEVRNGGREVILLHQNVHGGGPGAGAGSGTGAANAPAASPSKAVQEGTIWPDSLQPGGRLWIYRPVGLDEEFELSSEPPAPIAPAGRAGR